VSVAGESPSKNSIFINLELQYPTAEEVRVAEATRHWSTTSARRNDLLARWINRFKAPAKRGVNIVFFYAMVFTPISWTHWHTMAARNILTGMKPEYTGRAEAELDKIIAAVDQTLRTSGTDVQSRWHDWLGGKIKMTTGAGKSRTELGYGR
jgi:hypothetical protein